MAAQHLTEGGGSLSRQETAAPVIWSELEQDGLAFRPMGSRLRPPHSLVPLLPRETLIASLLADQRPLVLVAAPAGYGKTTTLAQWVAADPRPGAWLQLDADDDDPVVFLTYLSLALGKVTPLEPCVLDLLRRRTPPIDQLIMPALAAAVDEADPFLLVLDDGHLVQNRTCWRLLTTIFEQLPEGAQLCIAARSAPRLPMARLRADGRLAEYDMADLALDREEMAALLALHQLTLADAALDELQAATEGWPAGLRLSLLAGTGRQAAAPLPAVHGDQQAIAAFLIEEVLERLPAGVQRFLLRTSILDRLSPDLCRTVAEDDRAGARLAALARDNLFVVSLDDRGEWYRYHHLFAELLAALQARRAPEELPELHRRAATWHLGHDKPDRAVRHWLAAGDATSAAWPAFMACFELVDRGQMETARRMMDEFSEEQLGGHTALTFAAAWLYGSVVGDGARGERWRRIACAADVGDEQMPDRQGSWRGYQAGLRAFLAPDGVPGMLADAELSLACDLEAGVETWEARRALGVALYLNGRSRRAESCFGEMLQECDDTMCRSYALAFLSLIAGDEGRDEDAAQLDERAFTLTPEMGLDISPGMFIALPQLLSRVRSLSRRGDPETEAMIATTARYLHDMVPQVPWRVLLIALVLGEVRLARGQAAEAERWAAKAEEVLAHYPDVGMLRGRTRRLREALEERRMADPLTAAERRVLDLLPTQLTAGQMATRLFLTENTVKSHLSHIYRKLGVTTRTDAVEAARRLGLL
jgi:LuxR family maltose regulon positive regulatory protein